MSKQTLKARILAYYRERPGQSIPSGTIQRLVAQKTTYTPQNAGRRLRELAEDGLLKVEQVKGHAHYTYVPPATREERRVVVVDGVAREVFTQITN